MRRGGGQRWAGRQLRTHERAARTAPPPLPSPLQPPLQPPSPPLPPHQAAQASMCQSQQQSRSSRQSATRFNQRGKQVGAGKPGSRLERGIWALQASAGPQRRSQAASSTWAGCSGRRKLGGEARHRPAATRAARRSLPPY